MNLSKGELRGLALALLAIVLIAAGCDDKEKSTIHQSFEAQCGDNAFDYEGEDAVKVRVTVKNHTSGRCPVTVTLSSDEKELKKVVVSTGTVGTLQSSGVTKMRIRCGAHAGAPNDCKGAFSVDFQ